MAKINAAAIAAKVQALYKPKSKDRDIIATGANLKRPSKPEDFVLAPKGHPWQTLTGLLGIPYGIIAQVAGAPDSGKSTLAGQIMAEAQRNGVYVVLWDTERKFDAVRFDKHFKGNSKELLVVETTMIRKGAGAMLKYVAAIKEADPNARILLVHDSVGGSISRSRADRDIDDEKNPQPGSEAVENSDYMRHIVATFDKYPDSIALLLINQMTMKIGPMPGKSRSGGEKISFHSSIIVEMTRVQDLTKVVKGVKVKEGIISRAKIAKNHLSQSELSVHEMRVKVTAAGWQPMTLEENDNDEEAESSTD